MSCSNLLAHKTAGDDERNGRTYCGKCPRNLHSGHERKSGHIVWGGSVYVFRNVGILGVSCGEQCLGVSTLTSAVRVATAHHTRNSYSDPASYPSPPPRHPSPHPSTCFLFFNPPTAALKFPDGNTRLTCTCNLFDAVGPLPGMPNSISGSVCLEARCMYGADGCTTRTSGFIIHVRYMRTASQV